MPELPTMRPPLYRFAHVQGFIRRLEYLASMAEPEDWYYDSPNALSERQKQHGVLYQYIHHTFARAEDEGKLLETDCCALFNTGLFTPNGEEIYAFFTPNDKQLLNPCLQKWYLLNFYKESSRSIPDEVRHRLPAYVDYFSDCPEEMYFNPKLRIFINIDHIIETNFERLPLSVQALPRDVIRTLLVAAETLMRRRISRNNRLVVPQYYNKKIMYLAPLTIMGETIPLAIEKQENSYRVNTVLSKGMAYCNARLLMKPEINWLTNLHD